MSPKGKKELDFVHSSKDVNKKKSAVIKSSGNFKDKDEKKNNDDSMRDLKAMFRELEQEEEIRDEMMKIEEDELGHAPEPLE